MTGANYSGAIWEVNTRFEFIAVELTVKNVGSTHAFMYKLPQPDGIFESDGRHYQRVHKSDGATDARARPLIEAPCKRR